MTSKHTYYFTDDGSFGRIDTKHIIDTKNFTDTDWQRIEICNDSNRFELAKFIEEKRSK
jgi:hypothetical protein